MFRISVANDQNVWQQCQNILPNLAVIHYKTKQRLGENKNKKLVRGFTDCQANHLECD